MDKSTKLGIGTIEENRLIKYINGPQGDTSITWVEKTDKKTDCNDKVDFLLYRIENGIHFVWNIDVKATSTQDIFKGERCNSIDLFNISITDKNGEATLGKSKSDLIAVQWYYNGIARFYFFLKNEIWRVINNGKAEYHKDGTNEYYTINLNDLRTRWSFQISETGHFTWSRYSEYKLPLFTEAKLDNEYYDQLLNSSLF